ncbi:C-type lectin domain family 17, member A [Echinops telfairi]|uniref:C-type lectin domain family 17, member A n=1 Tax=Echinops telfairi TaxID=9371 RepID=A0AC55D1K4_ECHTE|nr:C-type lectin domain family 17, member A [Echinops telfairi]
MCTVYTNAGFSGMSGSKEEEEDDYENMTPPYKDLPPKPGSVAPPRPPRAGKKMKNSSLSCKSQEMAGLDLRPVSCTALQLGTELESSPSQPLPVITSVPWINKKPGALERCLEDRLLVCLSMLLVVSLLLACISLAVTLVKYQAVVEELRMLTFQQMSWQANVTGMAGLAGLKKDIERIKADTDQSLVELRGLLDYSKITCPKGWLSFEDKCYYFSLSTKSWEGARKFCLENYSHLVIINSYAEQLEFNFWNRNEPNNNHKEDCGSMNTDRTWNDLPCEQTAYWVCERKCSC